MYSENIASYYSCKLFFFSPEIHLTPSSEVLTILRNKSICNLIHLAHNMTKSMAKHTNEKKKTLISLFSTLYVIEPYVSIKFCLLWFLYTWHMN